jgi:tetratricopeptide (TPR) repeat protein
MHTIVREYAYIKLARDDARRKQVHKAVGDYYAAAIGDLQRQQHDFNSVQRILEAQYHYREAGDRTGIINTAAYVADELKPLVRQLYREGKDELASKLYNAILSMDDQDAEMHYYYGRLLEKQGGSPEEIERHYREALTLAPRVPERQSRYLIWLVKAKKYDEAQRAFKKAIEACRFSQIIYLSYTKVLRLAGRYDEAAAVLKEGLTRVPPEQNLFSLYQEYSQLLQKQNKLDEAAAVLKE